MKMAEESNYSRIQFDDMQISKLQSVYSINTFIDSATKDRLARELGVNVKQIQTWFQNRRARDRRMAVRLQNKDKKVQLQKHFSSIKKPKNVITQLEDVGCMHKSSYENYSRIPENIPHTIKTKLSIRRYTPYNNHPHYYPQYDNVIQSNCYANSLNNISNMTLQDDKEVEILKTFLTSFNDDSSANTNDPQFDTKYHDKSYIFE